MCLILSDIDGFCSLWYLPTYVSLSPTCQFEVKDYPMWTSNYMVYAIFFHICAAIHPESGDIKEGDKYHQMRNAITHLKRQPSELSFLVEKCLLTKVSFLADSHIIQLGITTAANQIYIKLSFSY